MNFGIVDFYCSSVIFSAFRQNFPEFHHFFQFFQKLTELLRSEFSPSAEFSNTALSSLTAFGHPIPTDTWHGMRLNGAA
jgi:hypothetical protein